MKRRIGYLVPEFPGQTHAFFWREMQAIEEAGVEVQLLSTRRPPVEACPHAFRDEARARTIYLFPPDWNRAAAFLLRHPQRLARAIAYVMSLSESAGKERLKYFGLIPVAAGLVEVARDRGLEHLHVHSCANAAHLAALAQILGDLPYSLTLHGDLDVYGRDHAAKVRRAAFVSAVTEPLRRQLLGVRPDLRAPVIWMGVDPDKFRPREVSVRSEGPVEFLSVARLNPTKGHVYFLRALQLLLQEGLRFHYTIVGEGPHRPEIEAEIVRLGLSGQVTLTGAMREDDVLARLRAADVFVLSSFAQGEAAPVAVMEAMACGLPVICSVIGGTPDMIRDRETGFLVPQQDVEGLAAAARALCASAELRFETGSRARAAALEMFDYRKMAQKLLSEINATA